MAHRQRGFTYLGLLFAIAIAGVLLAAVGVMWSTESQRQKEAELLLIGAEFRAAIASYYQSSPGLVKRYPAKLADLLKDDRFLGVRRHLRQIYIDPMTGTREWGLIPAPEGGIMGVHSLSEATPIKIAGFPFDWAAFEGKQKYGEWRFVYRPEVEVKVGAK
jgi:type II secretory pathway pseudopilin PulG